jgi:hypothetical protein
MILFVSTRGGDAQSLSGSFDGVSEALRKLDQKDWREAAARIYDLKFSGEQMKTIWPEVSASVDREAKVYAAVAQKLRSSGGNVQSLAEAFVREAGTGMGIGNVRRDELAAMEE